MLNPSPARVRAFLWFVATSLFLTSGASSNSAPLADSEVDNYNVRVGTQTFSPRYKFTAETKLVETAEAMRGMGSDITKFAMGKLFAGQYGITLPGSINSLTTLAQNEPSCRHVLDMSFRHYLLWTYTFASNGDDAWWKNGYTSGEKIAEYNEIYAFAQYLLTNYNNSGKSFYLGHWEGDWYLISPSNTEVNPSATATQGMIDWLNNRQKAVDDAIRDTPHTNVFLYHYTEVNRVRDAMFNPPTSNQRLVNTVLPLVTNIDYVSWSAYDGMHLSAPDLNATLDYIESNIPTNKASQIPGKRSFIGEYGWGGTLSSAAQEPLTRGLMQKALNWGAPFVLFWQMYDNENLSYWLIDSSNNKTPSYFLHQNFINKARLLIAGFKETQGRLPSRLEFSSLTSPILNQPLPALVPLQILAQDISSLTATSAIVRAKITQNIYGDEQATIFVFSGKTDGGTIAPQWQQSAQVAVNTNFNPTFFSVALTNLDTKTNHFFRFYISNQNSQAWAPETVRFSTDVLNVDEYGAKMKISLTGYNRVETLTNFPILVLLTPGQTGFSYRQFASRTGADLRLTDSTGAQPIVHEIDEWNTNGPSAIWVRFPELKSSNDFIWAYWGNPLATNAPAYTTNGSVWTNGFELVWHMKESANLVDSTAKHPGTSTAYPTVTSSGLIGRGAQFNGTSQFLNAGTVNLGNRFTVSGWVKVDPTVNTIQAIWANKAGGIAPAGFALFANSYQSRDQKLILETGNGSAAAYSDTATNLVTVGQWKHVAAAINQSSSNATLYIDGVDRTAGQDLRVDLVNNAILMLGRFTNSPIGGAYPFKGTMDEVRVEKEVRSANWIWATAVNVLSNSSFQSYSPVTLQIPTVATTLTGNSLAIRWPAHGTSFSLYSASTLTPPIAWIPVTNQPTLLSNEWRVTVTPMANTNSFYQLRGQ